ncbi:MAG: DsrE family protein [Gammaproteobacteria bacterium]|nr:DsrE family protein [Gammaproteobacteria bacterium]
MTIFFRLCLLSLTLLSLNNSVSANADSDISFIVAASKPPIGVIFEVIENNEKALELALQKINKYSKQLKKTIPSIKLAVVSHGTEQFALLTKNKRQYASTHNKVLSLMDNNVPVHVCGTHASWYSLSKKDFPDYVDVTVAGPKKIKEYQRLGYALIKIELD